MCLLDEFDAVLVEWEEEDQKEDAEMFADDTMRDSQSCD